MFYHVVKNHTKHYPFLYVHAFWLKFIISTMKMISVRFLGMIGFVLYFIIKKADSSAVQMLLLIFIIKLKVVDYVQKYNIRQKDIQTCWGKLYWNIIMNKKILIIMQKNKRSHPFQINNISVLDEHLYSLKQNIHKIWKWNSYILKPIV